MSGRKKKSALGIVLARSLDIGKTGKIKTGTWEAGLSGTGQSQSVQAIATQYGVLLARLGTIADQLKTVPSTRKKPLEERHGAIVESSKPFAEREVTNDETPRKAMLDDVNEQIGLADALILDIAGAVKQGEKPSRKITYTPLTEVTTASVVTVKSLGATADPPAALQLERGGTKGDSVTFARIGPGQKFTIQAAEDDTYGPTAETVTVNVAQPRREITWSPPAEIVWGTRITAKTLKATANGVGDPLLLEPEDGDLVVGDAVPLKIKAPGIRGQWLDGEATATVKVTRAPRTVAWPVPASLSVAQRVTPELLGATMSAGKGTLTVTAPAGGRFAAVGDAVDVTVGVAETATHGAASLTQKVKVIKGVPKLTWATPKSALVNAKLTVAQLNAVIDPATLKTALVYAPALDSDLTTIGNVFLRVSFAGDDRYEAVSHEVRLQVVADKELGRGSDAMRDGGAWKKPTTGDAAKKVSEWDDDDGSDPDSLKMMGQKLMAEIGQMTAEELNKHLDELQKKTPDSARTAQGGGFPNIIWTFKNGLQIRYKSNGDMHNPGKPMFCMEARTSEGPSTTGAQVAFKVTPDGFPAAKGPGDTEVPGDLTDEADIALFKSGGTRATHLFCRPKEKQVITWDGVPPEITADTTLSNAVHLTARALGGAKLTYTRTDGNTIVQGNKLPADTTQTLKVVAEATPRYEVGEATVTVKVAKRPVTKK